MLRLITALLGVVLLSPVYAAEPEATIPANGGSAVTVTRYFRQIEALEQQMDHALAVGDKVQLNQLLSPVFILQKADGSLASRDALDSTKSSHGALKMLHLHEVGNVLVAFVKVDGTSESSITDIWQAVDGTHWQLRLRVLPK